MAQARFGRGDAATTPQQRRHRREALAAGGVLLGVLVGGLGLIVLYLWLSWQRVYWADRVTETRASLAQLEVEHARLEAEVAEAYSLERLARWARQQGMVEPQVLHWPLLP